MRRLSTLSFLLAVLITSASYATEPSNCRPESIEEHLESVERFLRESESGFRGDALAKRLELLDKLAAYRERGVFPRNVETEYRNPIFIDPFGTHCAVGQLMLDSGYGGLAQEISEANNQIYVGEIDDPRIRTWADEHGFTLDELSWIQPGYCGQEEERLKPPPVSTIEYPRGKYRNDMIFFILNDRQNDYIDQFNVTDNDNNLIAGDASIHVLSHRNSELHIWQPFGPIDIETNGDLVKINSDRKVFQITAARETNVTLTQFSVGYRPNQVIECVCCENLTHPIDVCRTEYQGWLPQVRIEVEFDGPSIPLEAYVYEDGRRKSSAIRAWSPGDFSLKLPLPNTKDICVELSAWDPDNGYYLLETRCSDSRPPDEQPDADPQGSTECPDDGSPGGCSVTPLAPLGYVFLAAFFLMIRRRSSAVTRVFRNGFRERF